MASSPGGALNIVHYLPVMRLEEGGIVRAILDWCSVFAKRGYQMTLMTCDGRDIPAAWFAGVPGLPRAFTVPVPAWPGRQLNREALRKCEEAIRGADVLHLHAPWTQGNRQLGNLARGLGVAYIVSIHGMLDDWAMNQRGLKKRVYLSLVGRRFLNHAAAVHCTAEGERAQASKWFANPNTVVLPNLMDLQPFEEMPGPQDGLSLLPEGLREKPKVLFLSRLHEKKGVDVLIRAAALLRERRRECVVMVAGKGEEGYERYLHELTERLSLQDDVVFLGLVTGKTKISLYQAADLFVLPTQQENFGMVLAEALAAGTPVITTKGTDIWMEIEQAGGTIAVGTAQGIAGAIENLLSRRNEWPSLGERGRAWAFESLAMEPLARKYEAFYRTVAGIG